MPLQRDRYIEHLRNRTDEEVDYERYQDELKKFEEVTQKIDSFSKTATDTLGNYRTADHFSNQLDTIASRLKELSSKLSGTAAAKDIQQINSSVNRTIEGKKALLGEISTNLRQFRDQDELDRHNLDVNMQKKYAGKSYSDIEDAIKSRRSSRRASNDEKLSRETAWLERNKYGFMTPGELQEELKRQRNIRNNLNSGAQRKYDRKNGEEPDYMSYPTAERAMEMADRRADRNAELDYKINTLQKLLAGKMTDEQLKAAEAAADERRGGKLRAFADAFKSGGMTDPDSFDAENDYRRFRSESRSREDSELLKRIDGDGRTILYEDGSGRKKRGKVSDLLADYRQYEAVKDPAAQNIRNALWEAGYDFDDIYGAYSRRLNAENTEKITGKVKTFTDDHPVLANAASVPANLAGGLTGMREVVSGNEDVNDPGYLLSNISDTIRNTTSRQILERDHSNFRNNLANMFYQSGMSIADTALASAVGGLMGGGMDTKLAENIGQFVLSSSAGTGAMKTTIENGGTARDAMLTGLTSAAFEALFERVSLDNLIAATKTNTLRDVVRQVLKSTVTEGLEEVNTDIANMIADALINGNNSEYNRAVYEYMDQGYTAPQARALAMTDQAKQLGLSFAGGAIAGAGMTVGGAGYGAATRKAFRTAEETRMWGAEPEAALDLADEISAEGSGYEMTDKQAGRLGRQTEKLRTGIEKATARQADEAVFRQTEQSAKDMFSGAGVAGEDVATLATAAAKDITGAKLTKAENAAVEKNNEVYNEVLPHLSGEAEEIRSGTSLDAGDLTGRERRSLGRMARKLGNTGLEIADEKESKADSKESIVDSKELTAGRARELPPLTGNGTGIRIRNTSTGAESTVARIDRIGEDGQIFIRNAEGATELVAAAGAKDPEARTVNMSADGTKLLTYAAGYGNENAANAFLYAYRDGQDVDGFAGDFSRAVYEGLTGNTAGTAAGTLSPEQYNMGRVVGEEMRKKGTDGFDLADVPQLTRHLKTGVNIMTGRKLIKREEIQLRVLDAYAKQRGLKFAYVDKVSGGAAEGLFDGDDTIFIAKNTEHGAILATAGHELTHYIKTNSDSESWEAYKQGVLATLESKPGYDLEERIRELTKIYKKAKGYEKKNAAELREDVLEEIVANAGFDILTNKGTLERLGKEKPDLADRIRGFVTAFVSKIKELARGLGWREEQVLREDLDALDQIAAFADVLISDAGKRRSESAVDSSEVRSSESEVRSSEAEVDSKEQPDFAEIDAAAEKAAALEEKLEGLIRDRDMGKEVSPALIEEVNEKYKAARAELDALIDQAELPEGAVNKNGEIDDSNEIFTQFVERLEKQKEQPQPEVKQKSSEGQKKEKKQAISEAARKRDAEYMEAVRNGDTETAARMVEEAARAAGYTDDLLHGTQGFGFTVFDKSFSDDLLSFFFTGNEDIAQSYSGVKGIRRISEKGLTADGLNAEQLAAALNAEAGLRGDPLNSEYLHFSLNDITDFVRKNTEDIRKAEGVIEKLIKDYADRMATDFDEKDAKTHRQLVRLNDELKDKKYVQASTTLFLLNAHTDAFADTETDFSELDKNLRLRNTLEGYALKMTEPEIIVRNELDGYSFEPMTVSEAAEELNEKYKKGNYSLYGKPGTQLVIDGKGRYWNRIDGWYMQARGLSGIENTFISEEGDRIYLIDKDSKEVIDSVEKKAYFDAIDNPDFLHEDVYKLIERRLLMSAQNYGMRTRDISSWASHNGYDSVRINNLNDDGGRGFYDSEAGDIFIYFVPENIKSADPVTYDDDGNVIPLSERFSEKKDIRYAIKEGMSEEERLRELEKYRIEPVDPDMDKLDGVDLEALADTYAKKAASVLTTLAEKFGIYKNYSNDAIKLEFYYGSNRLGKSIHMQDGRYDNFAKMLSCFDKLVEEAVPIEIHKDKETVKKDPNLRTVFVLANAMRDENKVIPVQFVVKEFDNSKNVLYLSVALNEIEADRLRGRPSDLVSDSEKVGVGESNPAMASGYSIIDILRNVNPADGSLLKYVPDSLLDNEQLKSKAKELEADKKKYGDAVPPEGGAARGAALPADESGKEGEETGGHARPYSEALPEEGTESGILPEDDNIIAGKGGKSAKGGGILPDNDKIVAETEKRYSVNELRSSQGLRLDMLDRDERLHGIDESLRDPAVLAGNYLIGKENARALAGQLLSEFDSRYDADRLTDDLYDIFYTRHYRKAADGRNTKSAEKYQNDMLNALAAVGKRVAQKTRSIDNPLDGTDEDSAAAATLYRSGEGLRYRGYESLDEAAIAFAYEAADAGLRMAAFYDMNDGERLAMEGAGALRFDGRLTGEAEHRSDEHFRELARGLGLDPDRLRDAPELTETGDEEAAADNAGKDYVYGNDEDAETRTERQRRLGREVAESMKRNLGKAKPEKAFIHRLASLMAEGDPHIKETIPANELENRLDTLFEYITTDRTATPDSIHDAVYQLCWQICRNAYVMEQSRPGLDETAEQAAAEGFPEFIKKFRIVGSSRDGAAENRRINSRNKYLKIEADRQKIEQLRERRRAEGSVGSARYLGSDGHGREYVAYESFVDDLRADFPHIVGQYFLEGESYDADYVFGVLEDICDRAEIRPRNLFENRGRSVEEAALEKTEKLYSEVMGEMWSKAPDPRMKELSELVDRELRAARNDAENRKKALNDTARKLEKVRNDFKKYRAEAGKRTQEKIAEERQRFAEMYKQKNERQENTLVRQKTSARTAGIVKKLERRLNRPTDREHVPDGLRPLAEAFLGMFDVEIHETENSRYRTVKLKSEQAILSPERAQELYDAYKELFDNFDKHGIADKNMLDMNMAEELMSLIDRAKEIERANYTKGIQLIERERLATDFSRQLADFAAHLEHLCNHANEVILGNRRIDRAVWIRGEINRLNGIVKKNGVKEQNSFEKTMSSIYYSNLTPYYYAKEIGGAVEEAIDALFDGQREFGFRASEAKRKLDALGKKYKIKKWLGKDDVFTVETGTAHTRKTIRLTVDEALGIYAAAKREAAHPEMTQHLNRGGMIFEYASKKSGVKVDGKYVHTGDAVQLTAEDIKRITAKLTADQRMYADEVIKYLSSDIADWGNEVTEKIYGYKRFNEENYYPYHTEGSFIRGDDEKIRQSASRDGENTRLLINSGFTKAVQTKASTPLIVEGFTGVVTDHISRMASYTSMAIPQMTLNNLRQHYTVMSGDGSGQTVSFETKLQDAYGRKARAYLETLLVDITSGARGEDRTEKPFVRMFGRFKKTAVAANLSVIAQQPTAILRAFAMVNPVWFTVPTNYLNTLKSYKEAMKYSGTAIIKEMGGFDVDTGRTTGGWLLDYDAMTARGRLDLVTGFGAQKADEIGWGTIWEAVKRETRHKHPKMRGEELLKEAGKRFDEVVEATQVYDSVLTKSEAMRSQSAFMKMLTSFMAEPTRQLNMLNHARWRLVHDRNKGDAVKYAMGSAFALVVSAVLNTIMKTLVKAGRDDDEDRDFAEKYVAKFIPELVDSLNPLTMIPLVKDLYSYIQGYDINRDDVTVITAALDQAAKLYDTISDDGFDDMTIYQKFNAMKDPVISVAGTLGNLLGIPVNNVLRDMGIFFDVKFDDNGHLHIVKRGPDVSPAEAKRRLGFAMKEGIYAIGETRLKDANIFSGVLPSEDDIAELMVSGASDKDIETEWNDLVAYKIFGGKDEDKAEKDTKKKVKDLIEHALIKGEISEERAAELADKYFPEDNTDGYFIVKGWKWKAANPDSDVNWSKYVPLREALAAGKDITGIVEELVEHGTERDNIRDQVTGFLKDALDDGNMTEDKVRDYLVKNAGFLKSGKDDKLTDEQWAFRRLDEWLNTDEDGHYSMYREFDEAYKSGKDTEAAEETLRTMFGVSEDTIKKHKSEMINDRIENVMTEAIQKGDPVSAARRLYEDGEDGNRITSNCYKVFAEPYIEAVRKGDTARQNEIYNQMMTIWAAVGVKSYNVPKKLAAWAEEARK